MRPECQTPLVVGHTRAADGHTLAYRSWSAEAPQGAVVLLNGIMSHSAWFFPLVDPLVAGGLSVVGADRRGSGLDEVARGDAPDATTVIGDALAIIDAAVPAGLPIVLVGWCWGSVLALQLVRPLQSRLAALVLVAPGLFPSAAVSEAATRNEAAASNAAPDEPAIATPIAETMFTRGPWLDAFIRHDDRRLLKITPRFRDIMGKLALMARARLARPSVPLHVLLAEGDEATDNDAVLHALPPGTTVASTPSGHALQFDAPAFVTGEILALWRRLHPAT